MKKYVFLAILVLSNCSGAFSWGKTGHRVVGLIAEKHISKKARKQIERILKGETIAEVGNYMDFIRSDDRYDYLAPWHYATIPDNMTYEEAGTPEAGDAITAINRLIAELRSGNLSKEEEAFSLKCLIHLIGDLHQPLHVGNGEDKGGNDLKVEYFWEDSNLHRVWDSGIIDSQELSYTEYADWIDNVTATQIEDWQNDSVLDWAYESMAYRDQVYDLPDSRKINYRYDYNNLELVNQRLLQAGIRLAGILNTLYG